MPKRTTKPRAKASAKPKQASRAPARRRVLAGRGWKDAPRAGQLVSFDELVRGGVRASYDAAKTTDKNSRHWANADLLSGDAGLSPEIRRTLISRSRYENDNNGYIAGIVETVAKDTIGRSGPRLQMTSEDAAANTAIEKAFTAWFKAIDGAGKLRTMAEAWDVDGETFAMFITNQKVKNAVLLDIRVLESDQVSDPALTFDTYDADGITFDEQGNPESYKVLRSHPGSNDHSGQLVADTVPAEAMVHLFARKRATQVRGKPVFTSVLNTVADLRRFRGSTLNAAEIAALFAGILKTDSPANGEAEVMAPNQVFELESSAMVTVPAGWELQQMQAQHPQTTFAEFNTEVLGEIARPANVPSNIARATSRDMNFSSGQLDHLLYAKAVDIKRERFETIVLDRMLEEFLREFAKVSTDVPAALRDMMVVPHSWFWPSIGVIDEEKAANARAKRLESGMSSYAREYAAIGLDYRPEFEQQAKERRERIELGLPVQPLTKVGDGAKPAPYDVSPDETAKDEDAPEEPETKAASRRLAHAA